MFRRYHAYSENRSAAHNAQHCKEISEAGQEGLRRAVVKGLREEAARWTRAALDAGRDGLSVIKEEIIINFNSNYYTICI